MSNNDRIVCKFGGSSVADSSQFKKIKTILDQDSRRQVIVVSAPGKRNPEETKLTDLLYITYELALKGWDFSDSFNLIRERFQEIIADLDLKSTIDQDLADLEIKLKENPEEISEDYLVSRGEFLNAKVMAEFLNAEFIDAFDLIKFDSLGRVPEDCYIEIGKTLADSKMVVIPGFYGQNTKGELKTFSRGGSDISGAILANAIDAVLYENWTDVSGLLMADPRIVENPEPMAYVSYREIRELAYSGASVIHDEAISPCRKKEIKINIKNTNQPDDAGTIIGPRLPKTKNLITGIAGRKDFALIYIEKSMMNKEKGFGRKVLGILETYDISWEHAPTGIDSMCMIVDQHLLENVEDVVISDLERMMQPDKIKIFKNLALVATVGHGMTQSIGVAARLFSALAKENINVRVIDQGSSEINIICGIDNDNYDKAIRMIYKEFKTS